MRRASSAPTGSMCRDDSSASSGNIDTHLESLLLGEKEGPTRKRGRMRDRLYPERTYPHTLTLSPRERGLITTISVLRTSLPPVRSHNRPGTEFLRQRV